MIHVSTAYANCHLRRIDEKFYDYPVKYEDLDEIMDQMDEKTIDNMTSKWVLLDPPLLDPREKFPRWIFTST